MAVLAERCDRGQRGGEPNRRGEDPAVGWTMGRPGNAPSANAANCSIIYLMRFGLLRIGTLVGTWSRLQERRTRNNCRDRECALVGVYGSTAMSVLPPKSPVLDRRFVHCAFSHPAWCQRNETCSTRSATGSPRQASNPECERPFGGHKAKVAGFRRSAGTLQAAGRPVKSRGVSRLNAAYRREWCGSRLWQECHYVYAYLIN